MLAGPAINIKPIVCERASELFVSHSRDVCVLGVPVA